MQVLKHMSYVLSPIWVPTVSDRPIVDAIFGSPANNADCVTTFSLVTCLLIDTSLIGLLFYFIYFIIYFFCVTRTNVRISTLNNI
jgi:hypothetical protein